VRLPWNGPRDGLLALVVVLLASGLREAAADHVADRQDRRVQPDLVGGEYVEVANAGAVHAPLVTAPATKIPINTATYAMNSVVLNEPWSRWTNVARKRHDGLNRPDDPGNADLLRSLRKLLFQMYERQDLAARQTDAVAAVPI